MILCRARDEPSSSGPKSKACREKMRRDRLNDRYLSAIVPAYILVLIYYFDLQVSGIKFGYESW
jgi:hypothetical protein